MPRYEGASTVVANHSSWFDINLITVLKFPSFTPKLGIKKWPVIGTVCDVVFNSLFINRAGTPEERNKLTEEIAKRQRLSEGGGAPPLVMFPEGCTTNNTELIQFRRGAFMALTSVQPVTFKYSSPWFNPAHDILDVLAHIFLVTCQPYAYATVKELPVFLPNEYFFKHHQREGEERWATYLRVVRHIMAESLGFKETDSKLEDKFTYKELLYPHKGAKNKYE